MKHIGKAIALLLTLALCLSLAACSGEQPPAASPAASDAPQERTEVLELKLGQLGSERDTDTGIFSTRTFKEYVEEKTNGMIQITIYPDGNLGGEPEMLDQVIAGTLDIGFISSNVLGTIWPEFYMFSLPFAFPDEATYWDIADSPEVKAALQEKVDGSGVAVYLGAGYSEFRGCQNTKHPIRCADDFKGLTFRVMAGQIFTDLFQALGASTATVPFNELYTSLSQGLVDGEDISPAMMLDQNFYEIEKYHTSFNMVCGANPYVVSTACWDKLTDAEKQIFYEAALAGGAAGLEAVQNNLEQTYEALEGHGVDIIRFEDLTEEEINSCREAVQPIWDSYVDICGEEFYNLFCSVRDQHI